MGRLMVVVGGQYGSEAKGAVTAKLSRMCDLPLVVRVGGPNAGHTVIDDYGNEYKLRHVPVGFVNPMATLALAPGSEVNPDVLRQEIAELEKDGYSIAWRMHVDPQATLLDETHIEQETVSTLNDRLGSTAKGVGAARADRLWRTAELAGNLHNPVDVDGLITDWRLAGNDVVIEGTQGFGLGLHAGEYPYCTSGDCRAIDFMAQCGVSPWAWPVEDLEIWIVFRTRPIRVAGNSGPLPGETTWERLGLPNEYTTVTKKVRRVGMWDPGQAFRALDANGAPSRQVHIAITMLDQLFPEVKGATQVDDLSERARNWLATKALELGQPIDMIGTSPSTQVLGVQYEQR